MKRLLTLMLLLLVTGSFSTYAQKDTDKSKFGVKFSGFIKNDTYWDSRKVVGARENHLLLFPAAERLDENGDDINARSNFHMVSLQSRLRAKITGPSAFGAKTSGMVEGAFFGTTEGTANAFRLRHAFLKLNWSSTELLIGQFWHPMFATDCFAGTVSFNTAVPTQPFARNPQIRLTQKLSNSFKLFAAINSERDFSSRGPSGTSSIYSRNAGIPEINAGFKINAGKHRFGVTAGFKSILPEETVNRYDYVTVEGKEQKELKLNPIKSEETLNTFHVAGYSKIVVNDFSWKLHGAYGQNMSNLLMLGGYGVKSYDTINGKKEYTPTNMVAGWTELMYGKKFQVGLLAAYTKNLGTSDNIIRNTSKPSETPNNIYGFASNVESILRVSPRAVWNMGKVRLGLEVEFTQAQYGKIIAEDKAKIEKDGIDPVSNVRVIFGAFYFF